VVSNRRVRRERPCRGAADERDALTVSIDRIALGPLPVRARMQEIELAVVSQGVPGPFHNPPARPDPCSATHCMI
jgi:hypothetical protein